MADTRGRCDGVTDWLSDGASDRQARTCLVIGRLAFAIAVLMARTQATVDGFATTPAAGSFRGQALVP